MFVSQVAKLAIFPVIPAQFILEVEGGDKYPFRPVWQLFFNEMPIGAMPIRFG